MRSTSEDSRKSSELMGIMKSSLSTIKTTEIPLVMENSASNKESLRSNS
jgi:hypothetical protein